MPFEAKPPEVIVPEKGGDNLRRWPRGAELTRQVITESGTLSALLSFSCGKDAIACTLALREDMDLHPFFGVLVPGLSFVDEALDYYERKLFGGRRIIRAPHPALSSLINTMHYQPPGRLRVILGANGGQGLAEFTWTDLQDAIIANRQMPEGAMTAVGLRAADSILRRTHIARMGPINHARQNWMPVWDWKIGDIVEALKKHDVKLPRDYAMFGRTFDGLEPRFLVPIKRDLPEDWRRICEMFPLVEASVYQAEKLWGQA
jgi:hypothetical protein